MLIRREAPEDVGAVDAVHAAAFPSPGDGAEPVEVSLLRSLRDDAGWVPELSLLAEIDGEVVVGHVVGTEGSVPGGRVVGLGPLGVLPARQGTGIGGSLVHAVVAAADALGYGAVVLLGDVTYYARFGFEPATSIGIAAPDPVWGDHFQARRLAAWTPEIAGTFRYAAPFDEL